LKRKIREEGFLNDLRGRGLLGNLSKKEKGALFRRIQGRNKEKRRYLLQNKMKGEGVYRGRQKDNRRKTL